MSINSPCVVSQLKGLISLSEMKRLLLFISVCQSYSLYAGNDNFPVGARSAGLAHASVTLNDHWAVQHNQGALAFVKELGAGIYYENKFLVPELGLNALSLALPTKSGTFGLIYHSFGYSQYRESKFGISYGMKLGEKIGVGIGVNYNGIRIGDIYGNSAALTTEIGFRYAINEQLTLGAHVFNLNRAKLAVYNNEYIPTIFRLGAQYSFSKKIFLTTEANLDMEHPLVVKGGIEYRALDILVIRAGVSTNPLFNSFGFGLYFNNFQLDVAASYHQVLGFSPQAGLNFVLAKKNKPVPAE